MARPMLFSASMARVTRVRRLTTKKVAYPPTFYAVGREDFALQNLYQLLPLQIEHGVEVEIHTFAGVPHGQAGNRLVVGKNLYPNFELWLPLADAFMQNVFGKSKK